jgi:hypothetical protein
MSTTMRTQGRVARLGRMAAWRRVLVYAVLAFIAYTPVAKAVCELERLTPFVHVQEHAQCSAHEPAAAADDCVVGQDSCCGSGSIAVKSETRTASFEGLAAQAALWLPLVPAASLPVPGRAHEKVGLDLHRNPPPEPVFRRLPKLLI